MSMVSVNTPMSSLIDSLNDNQKRFLAARPQHRSDAKAAHAVGVAAGTVGKWLSRDAKRAGTPFTKAYASITEAMKIALANIEEFDIETILENELVPLAFRRYREILSIKITSETPPTQARNILHAAESVLKGTGRMQPDEAGSLNIHVEVAGHIAQGAKYVPAWIDQPVLPAKAESLKTAP